ncbi:MAG: methyltransferase domain-containing protein [Bacteroidales bacterium]|nr:methyltransferase domain-containing protein [Bacteroidales bacterium]
MNKEIKKRNLANASLRDNEDLPVLNFINNIYHGQRITLLEVGSGECRFVKKLKSLYKNIEITCIEINKDLAKIAEQLGCNVINANILDVKIEKKYDIVHCSHVIEHFYYPDVTKVLDLLISVVNEQGRLIIRSPLMWDMFYQDIDHIRPYPIESILNYFNCKQQQKQGKARITVDSIWYRTFPKKIGSNTIYNSTTRTTIFTKFYYLVIRIMNRCYQYLWNRYRWPATKPNGYVAIIKTNNN